MANDDKENKEGSIVSVYKKKLPSVNIDQAGKVGVGIDRKSVV